MLFWNSLQLQIELLEFMTSFFHMNTYILYLYVIEWIIRVLWELVFQTLNFLGFSQAAENRFYSTITYSNLNKTCQKLEEFYSKLQTSLQSQNDKKFVNSTFKAVVHPSFFWGGGDNLKLPIEGTCVCCVRCYTLMVYKWQIFSSQKLHFSATGKGSKLYFYLIPFCFQPAPKETIVHFGIVLFNCIFTLES